MHFSFLEQNCCWIIFDGIFFAKIGLIINNYADAFFWVAFCILLKDWQESLGKWAPRSVEKNESFIFMFNFIAKSIFHFAFRFMFFSFAHELFTLFFASQYLQ